MNLIDVAIIILFIAGILGGMKSGIIKGSAALIGTVIVFVLAFYLKNPLAKLFYTYLPFFNILNGAVVINILLYELIAFLIVISILSLALGIILKITGIIEKIFNVTIILGMISKLLGSLVGFIEAYVIIFILLFILNQPFIYTEGVQNSKIGNFMLNHTPVLTNIAGKTMDTITDIYTLTKNYDNSKNKDKLNYETLEVLLKHKVITSSSVSTLKDKNKLNFNGLDKLIEKYKEE